VSESWTLQSDGGWGAMPTCQHLVYFTCSNIIFTTYTNMMTSSSARIHLESLLHVC